jgi:hypothetical protein
VKASSTYESIASVLALVGVVVLVGAFYPMVNPEDYRREGVPLIRYILGALVSLFILATAWHFNCKATQRNLLSLEPRDKTLLLSFVVLVLPLACGMAAVLWIVTEHGPGKASSPRVISSTRAPDGKHLAELLEWVSGPFPVGDWHFEIRISPGSTNNAPSETIYKSPDEGGVAPRLLWSDDSRFLLVVGKDLGVGPRDGTATGEVLYLLYDSRKREVRCNSTQLSEPIKHFDFDDLTGINFGEQFRRQGS